MENENHARLFGFILITSRVFLEFITFFFFHITSYISFASVNEKAKVTLKFLHCVP